ncbi:TetR/AcrR family transcriptional regulator [uncultured Acetatifactor sp.]|uniref:TetR/AcrR family transcriptional regulator n=1 Tax=uncultured Acetatifactor sp. TaxID=1671927 RepID=UPI00261622EB|nr:TetR/AcrR family transcriptional regulator [uncultured Acetatifactor sp.]
MPKSYSEQERAYIRKRLKEEAADCLATYGVRRTTVDEIVRRVNIPKGTFYLFYQSKELLLFEVIQEQQQSINRRLFQVISGLSGTKVSAEELTDAIYAFYKMAEEMPILKLIGTGEVELLARRLPREVVQAHLQDDTDTIGEMLAMLPVKKDVDINVVSAAFHAVYYVTLHKAEIGEAYDQALRTLIYGIVAQLI